MIYFGEIRAFSISYFAMLLTSRVECTLGLFSSQIRITCKPFSSEAIKKVRYD